MKIQKVTGKAPQTARRASMLFSCEHNYRTKVVNSKKSYRRNSKHKKQEE